MLILPLPQEEFSVIYPLVDEVGCNRLWAVRKVYVVQSLNEQSWVVIQGSNDHLQTHGPQLAGLHPPHQTFQHCFHKQRDTLEQKIHKRGC